MSSKKGVRASGWIGCGFRHKWLRNSRR